MWKIAVVITCLVMYIVAAVHYGLSMRWAVTITRNWQTLNDIATDCLIDPRSSSNNFSQSEIAKMAATTYSITYGVNDCTISWLLAINVCRLHITVVGQRGADLL